MNEDIIREPVQLIDEDLDAVAGGYNVQFNIADVDQFISQFQYYGEENSQAAANVSSVYQANIDY